MSGPENKPSSEDPLNQQGVEERRSAKRKMLADAKRALLKRGIRALSEDDTKSRLS